MFDIQKFMNRNAWGQQELADKMGIKRSKVATWCAGYRLPDYEMLCKFFDLGMTLNEAFGPVLEAKILKSQPSLDLSNLTAEDCRRIVSVAFGSLQDKPKDP